MKLIPPENIIKLKPRETCPYKEVCYFSNKSHLCYGTLVRECEFICNLKYLQLMYKLDDKEILEKI
jgi:hypothetical protein